MTMRVIPMTDRKVASLAPNDQASPSKAIEYTDKNRPGLKLQVGKGGRKTWYYRYTYRTEKCCLRIGEFPVISTDAARTKVLDYIGVLEAGRNPKDDVVRIKKMPTVTEYAVEYMSFVSKYKRSADDDEAKLRMYVLPAFGDKLLCDVTTKNIQMYLANLADKLKPGTLNRHLALLSKSLCPLWGRDLSKCLIHVVLHGYRIGQLFA